MLKKFFATILCFIMLFSISACQNDVVDNPDTDIKNQQSNTDDQPENTPESEPESEPEDEPESEPEKLSFDEFIKKAGGVWVYIDSIEPFGEEYSYSFCTLSSTNYSGGAYPGGGDRPAKIDGFEQTGENVFELNLLYEAGYFMGDELPESRSKLVVTLSNDNTAKFKIDDGNESLCLFGGPDLPDAQTAIANHINK